MRFLKVILAGCLAMCLAACSDDAGQDQFGNRVVPADWEGQWLIINYWAEWCGPCRIEIPQLNALSAQLVDEPITILGVNFDGLQGDALREAANAMNIEFTVLETNPAERFQLPPANGLPVTYIVDGKGKLRQQLMGEQTAESLLQAIASLRAE